MRDLLQYAHATLNDFFRTSGSQTSAASPSLTDSPAFGSVISFGDPFDDVNATPVEAQTTPKADRSSPNLHDGSKRHEPRGTGVKRLVEEIEKRQSAISASTSPRTSPRKRTATVEHGLVPKPLLVLANPD